MLILPPPHYATRFRFYRKNGAGRFPLVDTHRIAPTHAAFLYRLSAVVVSFGFSFFKQTPKSHPRRVCTPEPTLLALESNRWTTGGTGH